jgi:hypothetical protein
MAHKGALGVPLVAERSIAIDPRSVPLGGAGLPCHDPPEYESGNESSGHGAGHRGAIKGAVRADFFWGFGQGGGGTGGSNEADWPDVGFIASRSCTQVAQVCTVVEHHSAYCTKSVLFCVTGRF